MSSNCPVCNRLIAQPTGSIKAKILWITEPADDTQVTQRRVFAGMQTHVCKSELKRFRIPYESIRVVSVLPHNPVKAVTKNDVDTSDLLGGYQTPKETSTCEAYWKNHLLTNEILGRRLIVVVGKEAYQMLCPNDPANVDMRRGLFATSSYTDTPIFVLPKPKFSGGIGEFRWAITNFAEYVQQHGILE